MLGEQALNTIPFISNLYQELKISRSKKVSFDELTKKLGLSLNKREVKKTLDLILEWSTYGELIDLDFKARKVFLSSENRAQV